MVRLSVAAAGSTASNYHFYFDSTYEKGYEAHFECGYILYARLRLSFHFHSHRKLNRRIRLLVHLMFYSYYVFGTFFFLLRSCCFGISYGTGTHSTHWIFSFAIHTYAIADIFGKYQTNMRRCLCFDMVNICDDCETTFCCMESSNRMVKWFSKEMTGLICHWNVTFQFASFQSTAIAVNASTAPFCIGFFFSTRGNTFWRLVNEQTNSYTHTYIVIFNFNVHMGINWLYSISPASTSNILTLCVYARIVFIWFGYTNAFAHWIGQACRI